VPRTLQQHLVDDPTGRCWTAEGTAAFVDISGFTQLSEQLARKGREGAEQITDAIGGSFESILLVAYQNGGGLLKFGGDALLLWFHGEDHAERACRATVAMRRALEDVGRIELPDAQVTLQMSQGVHSGNFHFFAVGTSHVEFLPAGPAWSRLVAMEHEAGAGEIVISSEAAALLPSGCVGNAKGPGLLLRQEPPGDTGTLTLTDPPPVPPETLVRCLPPAIRAHVLAGGGAPEHRPVTIAFIRFEGVDALIDQRGPAAAAEALHRVVSAIEAAIEEQDVSFLASDVDADGGKLILTSGAPKVTGNDEERMLLALRKIVSSDLPIPLRVGVHRGAVFAGDIGPGYRRTYTVMGDAVNLTARLMAKALPGQIYATADVLDRSNTLFETTRLEPFAVKGKAEPVQAWSVGPAQGSRTRQVSLQRLPLTGRNAELGVVRKAFASARSGTGRLLEVVGDAGIGKTRLLEALRDAAAGFHKLHATCEAYTSGIPYVVWRELLREMLEFGRDTPDADIVERIRAEVATKAPELAPWLPLLAAVLDVEIAATPEVLQLAEANRRTKLHETVARFLEVMVPDKLLVEIDDAHDMDKASAELLAHLTSGLATRPWLFAIARRPSSTGFVAPEAPEVVRIELKPIAPQDALRLAQ
jgi:class 3 adenylate cyclase